MRKKVIWILMGLVIVFASLAYFIIPRLLVRYRCIPWHELTLSGVQEGRDYLFVAMGACDSVLAIDTTTQEVAAAVKIDGQFPHGIAATLDRKYIFTANERSDDLTVISVDGFKVVNTIAVDDFPTDVVPSMDGQKLFVANFKGGTVQVVDKLAQRVERTLGLTQK